MVKMIEDKLYSGGGQGRKGVKPRATYLFRLHFLYIFRYSVCAFPSKYRSKRPFSCHGIMDGIVQPATIPLAFSAHFSWFFVRSFVWMLYMPTDYQLWINTSKCFSRNVNVCKNAFKAHDTQFMLQWFLCSLPTGEKFHCSVGTTSIAFELTILLEGNRRVYTRRASSKLWEKHKLNGYGENKTTTSRKL